MEIQQKKLQIQEIAIFLFFGLFFSSFLFINQYFNSDLFLTAVFIAFLIFLVIEKPNFCLRYPYLIFTLITNIFGVIVIENTTIWLVELSENSIRVNSLPLLVFNWYIFLLVIFGLELFVPDSKQLYKNFDFSLKIAGNNFSLFDLVLVGFSILLVYFLIRVLPHPAFIEHLDRFLYAKKYFTNLDGSLMRVLKNCLPILFAAAIAKKHKLSILLIVAYIIFQFCIGEKFGLFFMMVCFFSIIYSIKGAQLKKNVLRKFVFKLCIVAFGLVLVVFFHRMLTYGMNTSNMSYLYQRLAQNGQIWWKLYAIEKDEQMHISEDEFEDETNVYFRFNEDNLKNYNYGIYKIMRKTTPISIFLKKVSDNSSYANSTYATMFHYFKEPGMLVYSILAGMFYWLLTRYLLLSVKNMYLVDIFLCGRLWFLANSVITQSDFDKIFIWQTFFSILIIITINVFRSNFGKHKVA